MEFLIETPCGMIRGTEGKYPGTKAFKGIRYARAARWKYPKLVKSWAGIYDATSYGACSYQPRAFYNEEENLKKIFYYNEFRKGETYTYDEDCLFLNIFTPETAEKGSKLPVLIYIHGGGFTGGCGHEKHFDQPVWATKGIIGVTLNYRLGPMGFVCLPELKEESGFTGNYGLFDQAAAMVWIKRNIEAFGGDPDNITIMGQSAGAMSVQQHCLSPFSGKLFHKAVMSSGGGVSKMLSASGHEKSYDFWHKVMELAECESLAEFRALPPEKLFECWNEAKKEMKGGGCFPCIDGKLVVDSGSNILAKKKQRHIPYMLGSTSEDMMPPIIHNMAKSWAAEQDQPSYLWYFERQLPGDDAGAWHSSDLWYWFGTLDNCWRPMEETDYALSNTMVDYLTNFVKTGNPNGADLPIWQEACGKKTQALRLGQGPAQMGRPAMLGMIHTMLTNKAVGE